MTKAPRARGLGGGAIVSNTRDVRAYASDLAAVQGVLATEHTYDLDFPVRVGRVTSISTSRIERFARFA